MLNARLISSLQKCFIDEKVTDKPELKELTAYKNEKFSFQLCYRAEGTPAKFAGFADISVATDLVPAESDGKKGKPAVTLRTVEQVVCLMPVIPQYSDADYLRKEPGLFPDVLIPARRGNKTPVCEEETRSVWIEFDPGKPGFKPGDHKITVSLTQGEAVMFEGSLDVHVVDAELPKQELINTQWFHCDSLASYYNVPVFSNRHWKIIENYVKTAVRNGMNMILTPVLTPPLDTYIGGERLTTQLVDVKVTDKGYEFGFEKLKRWVKMCKKCGIEYYEISHLFTQWGAGHAPKVMADVNGSQKRIFGWDTDSCGKEYRAFLAAFIPALLAELKALGVDKNCRFHISDEPSADHLEIYKKAKSSVAKLLKGYPIMDALSSIDYYKDGIVEHPVPACDHIEPFYEAEVPDLWTYYCCGQHTDVPNRFISQPSYRNRIIGFLFYKYDIKGFLQWGYNFYNSQYSYYPINPYISVSCDYFSQAGDAFSVWPAQDGTPYESLRLSVFSDAVSDLRALRLCESIYGREQTVKFLEEDIDRPLKFADYPKCEEYILNTRKKIDKLVEEGLRRGK